MPSLDPDYAYSTSQTRVLVAVRAHKAAHGTLPSRKQIMAAAGTSSSSYVDRVVAKMKTRGDFR